MYSGVFVPPQTRWTLLVTLIPTAGTIVATPLQRDLPQENLAVMESRPNAVRGQRCKAGKDVDSQEPSLPV